MNARIRWTAVATLSLAMASTAWAADTLNTRDRDRLRDGTGSMQQDRTRELAREPIYGSRLMTDRERTEYRARIWAAKTEQERERIRAEHHVQMQERARERGVELPAQPPRRMPPATGPGMGRGGAGGGMGGGMGSGMGSGIGGGRSR